MSSAYEKEVLSPMFTFRGKPIRLRDKPLIPKRKLKR